MSEYEQAAMMTARFDELSNGGWFGALPRFHGVYAWGRTAEDCYHALQTDQESAIEEALRNKRVLPDFVDVSMPVLEQV